MGKRLTPEEMGQLTQRLSAEGPSNVRRLLRDGAADAPAASQRGLPPELSAAYDAALDRAGAFARRAETLPAGELDRFREALALLQSGKGVMALAHEADMLLEGLGVYEALLTRSWAVRYENPDEMCHLARAAVDVAGRLDPEVHGGPRVTDYQARACGELANSLRVADRLQEAEEAFGMAFSLARRGTGDPRLRARLLDLEASLLGTLREFDLALPRLTALSELRREEGDSHQAGRALISKAVYTFYNGKPQEACRIISEALTLIDGEREPDLVAAAAINQLLFLVECGRCQEARKILFRNRAWFSHLDRVLSLKVRWIDGRISYVLWKHDSAEIAFREVQKGFEEAGMGFACALAGFDLALALMRQGRVEEATAETLQSAEMFLALNIHREVLGVVIFLEQEFRAQRGSFTLLQNTVRYLRRKEIELRLE